MKKKLQRIILVTFFCFFTSQICLGQIKVESPDSIIELLTKLKPGSSFEELDSYFPNDSLVLKEYLGPNNENVVFELILFEITLRASFSYHDKKLISHGVSARGLKKGKAFEIYQYVKKYLTDKHGIPINEVNGEAGIDGHTSTNWVSSWSKDGVYFGTSCSLIYDGYMVSWGAQRTSNKK